MTHAEMTHDEYIGAALNQWAFSIFDCANFNSDPIYFQNLRDLRFWEKMAVETQRLFSLWDSIKLDNFDDVGEIGVNSSGMISVIP